MTTNNDMKLNKFVNNEYFNLRLKNNFEID